MKTNSRFLLSIVTTLPLATLVACGSSTNTSSTSSDSQPAEAEEQEASEVPQGGTLLATCQDNGEATINGFLAGGPVPGDLDSLPTLDDLLAEADAADLSILGGLVEGAGDPDTFVALTVDETLAMLEEETALGALGVSSEARAVCQSDFDAEDPLGTFSHVLGVIPVFDEMGDPVAVAVVTVGDAASSTPLPIESVGIPEEDVSDILPNVPGEVTLTVLQLLGILGAA